MAPRARSPPRALSRMDDSVSAPSPAPVAAPAVDHELLVAQLGWVRSVATNLVRDHNRAEDVTQETVLAALSAPPRDAADAYRLRAWLGRVAFNLSKLGARQGLRRRAREERVARPEALPSVLEEVESLVVLRELGEAVRALPVAYRQVVELRYFEGLSTAEIAARAGTTELAVRKRLWRARARLRDTLEEPEGARRAPAWWPSAVSLARWLRPSRSLTAAAAAAGVVALSALSMRGDLLRDRGVDVAGLPAHEAVGEDGGSVGTGVRRAAVPLEGRPGERGPVAPDRDGLRRGEVSMERDEGARPGGSELALAPVSGLVVALDGNPVAGLELHGEDAPGTVLAHSDRTGTFRFDSASAPGRLVARGVGWTTIVPAVLDGQVDRDATVVVAPSAPLVGTITSRTRSLERATLDVVCSEAAFLALEFAVRLDSPLLATATIGPEGTFALGAVPRASGIALRVHAPGHVEREIPTLELGGALWLELEPDDVLEGLVLHADGSPAAGARVRLGLGSTTSDHEGRFQLPLRGIEPWAALEVSGEGVESVREPGFGRLVLAGLREDMTLTLGAPYTHVEGLLADADGTRRVDWRVHAFTAGAVGPAESPAESVGSTSTDADGRFHLQLPAGRYSLVAVDGSGESMVLGDGLDTSEQPWALQVAAEPSGWVGGQVFMDGLPASAAHLEVALLVGPAGAPSRVVLPPLETRTDGRWGFRAPLGASLFVQADVPGAGPRSHAFQVGSEPVAHWLSSTCAVRVDARGAESLQVLDRGLSPLRVQGPLGACRELSLSDGRSPLLEVGVDASWLLLSGPAGERLVPVSLEAGRRVDVHVE
jgi:RNA polymerase sigma factor (sigma-70 family)